MIVIVDKNTKNKYQILGPLFGSREVQRVTNDRFYDDEDKVWYLYKSKSGYDTFVSVKNDCVKNVYSRNKKHLIQVLQKLEKIEFGKVPAVYKEEFEKAGFDILKVENNFVSITKSER